MGRKKAKQWVKGDKRTTLKGRKPKYRTEEERKEAHRIAQKKYRESQKGKPKKKQVGRPKTYKTEEEKAQARSLANARYRYNFPFTMAQWKHFKRLSHEDKVKWMQIHKR